MAKPEVLSEIKDRIGWIWLDRPEALNALSLNMIQTLQELLHAWENDDRVRAVIVQSKSEKAFCAGGDIRWLYQQGLAHSSQPLNFFWHEYRLNHTIANFPKPYISLLNGITMGGGVGISLHGSHPVATEHFQFAMPETGIGFFPDIGGGYLLSRCHGHTGFYLGLCGSRIDVHQATDAGLIRYFISSDDTEALIAGLRTIRWNEDLLDAHHAVEEVLKDFVQPHSPSSLQSHYDEIEQCFNFNQVADIMSALAQREDDWGFGVLRVLSQKSPTSLCLTLEQLHRAQDLTLAECLKMEFRMVSHLMKQGDFFEGVRALIIDKDKKPRWNPADISKVKPECIQAYFKPQSRELGFS